MKKATAIQANESSAEEEDNLDVAWMQQDDGLSLEELEAMGIKNRIRLFKPSIFF